MNHYPFIYQVKTYYYDTDYRESLWHICAGVGFCDNYTDAVSQVESYFGDELASIEHLEMIGEKDEKLIPVKNEWVNDFIHTDMTIGDKIPNGLV